MTNMEESIWVWDPSTGNFKTRNSSQEGTMLNGIIPSSQAFFIRTTSPTASITIPQEAKTHQSQPLYKSSSFVDELQYIALQVYQLDLDSVTDEIWVGFHNDATEEFDNGIVITKMMGDDTSPQLYLQENRLLLSIDILPELNGESRTVSLLFRPPYTATYFLKTTQLQNLDGVQIFLEDLQNGDLIDVKAHPLIKFAAQADDQPNRFMLHFNPINTPAQNITDSDVQIYAHEKVVYISLSNQWSTLNKNVFIYDITGRLIHREPLGNGKIFRIPTPINHQSILVKLQCSNQIFTQKLIIN